MTAHSSSTPHRQKQTSHSASFPCVCHGQREFWVERLPPGRGEHGSGSTRDVPPRRESSRHVPPRGRSSTEVPPRRRSSTEVPPHRRCSRLVRPRRGSSRDVPPRHECSRDVPPRRGSLGKFLAGTRRCYRRMHAIVHSQMDQISGWARLQDDLKASFEQATGVIRQLNESNAKLHAEHDLLRVKIVGSVEQ